MLNAFVDGSFRFDGVYVYCWFVWVGFRAYSFRIDNESTHTIGPNVVVFRLNTPTLKTVVYFGDNPAVSPS